MKQYDFALYENVVTGINHQKDVHIIARLLCDSGYDTVILGYCNEISDERNNVVNINNPYPKPVMEKGSKISFFHRYLKYYINRRKYNKYFLRKIKGISRNYYCGSFLQETDSVFLKQHDGQYYFFWGLRSHLLRMTGSDFINPMEAIRKWRKIQLVKKNPNIKFFISNEIIRKEFVELGISPDRLVFRPERFVEDSQQLTKQENEFSFLSIGTIRVAKRIPMIIEAFKQASCNQSASYNIIGRCDIPALEKKIETLTKDESNIDRVNRRLTEGEYVAYMQNTHFLVLADVRQKSSVTNGTMMEALFGGKPIIAPNYDPYRYYINKYRIGILYDDSKITSLSDAMDKAFKLGINHFNKSIAEFISQNKYSGVLDQFKKELFDIGITPFHNEKDR